MRENQNSSEARMLSAVAATASAPANGATDPVDLKARLQRVVDEQALYWNTSFSLGLVWGSSAQSVAVAASMQQQHF